MARQISHNAKTMLTLVCSLAALFLSILINFFLSPYIVKYLGEEANGFIQLANNMTSYAALMTLALNSMASRFMTVSYHEKDYEKCNRLYASVIIGNLLIFLVLVCPAAYFIVNLEDLVQIETANVYHVKLVFTMMFSIFFVSNVVSFLNIAISVKNAQYWYHLIRMVRILVYAGSLLIIFSVWQPKIYYVSMINLIAMAGTIPVFYVLKRKLMPEVIFRPKNFRWFSIKELVSSGIWNVTNQCGNLLMTEFDLLLTNLYIGPKEMGVLSVARVMPSCVAQLASAVTLSFTPNLTIAYAEKEPVKVKHSLQYAMKCSMIIVGIPVACVCVFGTYFYKLWVPSMDAKMLAVLSLISCLEWIPFAGTHVLRNVFTAANKLKVNSLAVVGSGVLNIVLVLILLKTTNLGIWAIAGVSAFLAIGRKFVVTVPYGAKVLGLKWHAFYPAVGASCGLFAGFAGIGWIFVSLLQPKTWGLFLVTGILTCGVSLIFAFLVLFNMSEKKRMVKASAKIFTKLLGTEKLLGKNTVDVENIPSDIQYALVLGAVVKEDKDLSPILKERLEKVVEIHKARPDMKFVLSGDSRNTRCNDVDVMRIYLTEREIPEDNLILDGAGYTTYASIKNVKKNFPGEKILLITSSFHEPRAFYLLKKKNVNAVAIAMPLVIFEKQKGDVEREYLATVKAFVMLHLRK